MIRRHRAYFVHDVLQVETALLTVRATLRNARGRMTSEEFRTNLHAIEFDEGVATDWLASDGILAHATARMLPYLWPPALKVHSA